MSKSDDLTFDTSFKWLYLHPKHWLTWLSIGVLILLAWLPVRWRDRFAARFVPVLIRFSKRQCNVARTNLRLCFPDLTDSEREVILRDSIRVGLQTFLGFAEGGILPQGVFNERYRIEGWEHVEQALATHKPIIFMIPHSWAIDMGGMYLTRLGLPMCTMMHSARNPVYDWFINWQRARFGGQVFERSAGIKSVIKSMRSGRHFFYLPDQDHGAEASLFVPLFGELKATLPALPKLVRLADAQVIPMFASYLAEEARYELVFRPIMTPYPTADLLQDTRRMNEEIEIMLASRREQYMWFLKYFRSRPEGDDRKIYD